MAHSDFFREVNLGRWISRDPLAEAAGLNMYAYCGDNPVCNIDPSGLDFNPFTSSLTLNMGSPPDDPFTASLSVDTGDNGFSGGGGCMEDSPINPLYSQDQLAQLAIAHFEGEGYPAWLATAMVNAGVFAMNNESALETINNILTVATLGEGAEARAGVTLTEHALEQMAARGVSEEAIYEAIENGIQSAGNTATTTVYDLSSAVSSTGQGVRVVLNNVTNAVVTVINKGSKFAP